MSGTETLGGMAEALAAARAVEPTAGDHVAGGHTHESACLNCGTALVGSHCHACGQAAHVHRTLGAFFHDLLHGVFHFEGKIWRTLPLLALQPGKLTREYIDGRRASYVSPIALFLFCVFLMFTTINSLGSSFMPTASTTVDAIAQQQREDLKALEARKATAKDPGEKAEIEGDIADAKASIEGLEKLDTNDLNFNLGDDNTDIEGLKSSPLIYEAVKIWRDNPSLALYKVQTYSYKLSWALIPISVPFLWLLFPFSRRFGLYDHTVFVTYSLCFMTLLAVVTMLAATLNAPWLGVFGLLPPLHMLVQLRGTYALSWFGAWWRTWFLSMFAFTALMLFATLILVEAGG
ncbi:MAG: DUF3667 domain-containing protein [Novosphingobium sp.]|uniref:DUF3667 domain-containing protein n=1 Tax=Novosphingobium sp. TaxID=1874826 RepID=UPI002734C104|nr:DUF3667 domain-containing protein [Novosphingobium sp.]MDP3552007.1 DUF3667 domain-containing protein [Novosphingobium sp.]